MQGFYVLRAAKLAQQGATPESNLSGIKRNEKDNACLFHGR